jgi:hypothetical protein
MTATELTQAAASLRPTDRRWLRPFGALFAGQLVAGLLIGLLWRLWAPSSVSYLLSNGAGGSIVIPDESEAQIAGDGRFVLLSLLAGALFGLFGWTVRRYRGPVMAAVLAVGSLLGSVLAMATGRLLSGGTGSPALNTAFHPRLVLHASAALFVQAFIAVLVYTVLAGLSRDPALGLSRDPALGAPPHDPTRANRAEAGVNQSGARTDNARTDNARTDNARTDNARTDNARTDNARTDNAGVDNAGGDQREIPGGPAAG